MTLDGMVKIAKADQYTDEGKQTIEDARRTYKTGEISQATGLQKQPDGSWAPPKAGAPKGAKNTAKTAGSSTGKPETSSGPAKEKTFTFTKAGHVYNVPASSPAEAVQKLKARGVKGFKESDAFDDSTPRSRTGSSEKKDVAAEQTARNEAMKAAENESQNAAVFNDLNEKAATEGREYKIRKTKAGEYYWDVYRDGKLIGGGSARDKTEAINRANKNFEEYIKENKTAASREAKYKKEGFSNLKKYDNQDAAEAEMWDYIRGTERTKADVDTIKLYKAPDGKYKWTDDPAKQKKLEGYGYEETQKSDWLKNQTKENKPEPKRESVSSRRMQKDLDGNFWSRPEDFKEDIASRGWDVEEMTNEYAVISNEAGSQYEVRFDDHSDDGDLTVRTFKPLMIDEDDEDTDDSAPLTGDTKIRVRK